MAYVITEKAATALTRLLRGDKSTGNTGARGAPATISPDAFPAPFSVRWSASEDSGNGAWVIWLPNAAQLLVYDGSAVTITGVTAATSLPSGWYTVNALQASSTAVYLVVTVVEATGVASAALANTTGQASTGQKVYNLLVATMSTDATTGAKLVKQFVDSAVTIGGGSSAPLQGSVEFVADVDWYVDNYTHVLRKRLRVLDLATGQVTDKAGTTYANGWEVAANSVGISSIIGS